MTDSKVVDHKELIQLMRDNIRCFLESDICGQDSQILHMFHQISSSDIEIMQKLLSIRSTDKLSGSLKNFLFHGEYKRLRGRNEGYYIIHFNDIKDDFMIKFPSLSPNKDLLDISNRLTRIEQYQANILDKLTVLAEIIDSKKN